jgi:hypothetical protein
MESTARVQVSTNPSNSKRELVKEHSAETNSVSSNCHFHKIPSEIREMIFVPVIEDHFQHWWGYSSLTQLEHIAHDPGSRSYSMEFSSQTALIPERKLYRELLSLRMRRSIFDNTSSITYPSHFATPKSCPPLLQRSIQRMDLNLR